MANRCVLVHHCFNAWTDEGKPTECDCRRFITRSQAEARVGSGAAIYRMEQRRNGNKYVNLREIVLCGREPMVPRAPTVDKAHIERAYVYGIRSARNRIEFYGRITQEAFGKLGAGMRVRGPVAPPTAVFPPQPDETAAVSIWDNWRTKLSGAVGSEQQVFYTSKFADCVKCGGRVTDPRSYPRVFPLAERAMCPFCGELAGLRLGPPGPGAQVRSRLETEYVSQFER